MKQLLLTLSALLASSSLSLAQEKSPSPSPSPTPVKEVQKHENIKYYNEKDADKTRHLLDVYEPKKVKDAPILIYVHGGSWRSGNKDLYAPLGKMLAEQGIVTIVINYRLTGGKDEVKHPDHITDVARAFAWAHKNAAKYGGDVNKLFVSGHSAGGHLVALLATDETYLKAHSLKTNTIKGVIALSGVYQIVSLVPLFHPIFGKEDAVCKAASPSNHVREGLPPFLIAYADQDLPTLGTMAEQFAEKIKDKKNKVELLKLEKRDHITIISKAATSLTDPLTEAIIKFVKVGEK